MWALYKALALLDSDSRLVALTVEGIRAEDENGTSSDTWDGVDCALYYGDDLDHIDRIEIVQLKYSAANPSLNWTIPRLVKDGNKSIIRKLGKAFDALSNEHQDLFESDNLIVRLVSNQPVSDELQEAVSSQEQSGNDVDISSGVRNARDSLIQASSLSQEKSEAFLKAMDLSECGSASRFAVEERVLSTVSGWTEDGARTAVNDLMRFIRQAMMPESKGQRITRHLILVHFGFSDHRSLFPCPSEINEIQQPVQREISGTIARKILDGVQHICLHGGAGCGKTTAIQEIRGLLPPESIVIAFDCYGSGRYKDSDAYRHRPRDAFLQLSNELAATLHTPLLITRSRDIDYPRVFKQRLEKAAEVIAAKSHKALMVIVVDAADNSITAASNREPKEQSFIHDFMALGELPSNVRFIVTTRTAGLVTLRPPERFDKYEISGFSREDTGKHVLTRQENVPELWIDDFHYLSGGNPRVQKYAFDYGGDNTEKVLGYLRPHGKSLNQIFEERFTETRGRTGNDSDITIFCTGIIALPRPIPVAHLAQVVGLNEELIRDLCMDLHPGIYLDNDFIEFADEDFENFIRSNAVDNLDSIQIAIADHFSDQYQQDTYAATHVAAALLKAGRREKIITLVNTEPVPVVIQDPVLKQEVQLQRFRIAMKVCRGAGNVSDALLTILSGTEAMSTDEIIKEMLFENLDLAACFAQESLRKLVLREPKEIKKHGPVLCHLMAVNARDGNDIEVREGIRQFNAWINKRQELLDERQARQPERRHRAWDISITDITASIEAVLRIDGPEVAISHVLAWRPRTIALDVALILAPRLIASGDYALIEACLQDTRVSKPWDIFLLIPLALSGRNIDVSRLEVSLASPLLRSGFRLDEAEKIRRHDNAKNDYIDVILTACEVAIALGADRKCVTPVLKWIANPDLRRIDMLHTSHASLIDWTLRAHTMLQALEGTEATLESYLTQSPQNEEVDVSNRSNQSRVRDDTGERELREAIGPLLNIYYTCAQILVGTIDLADSESMLQSAIDTYGGNIYHMRDYRALDRRTFAALAIARLIVVPNISPTIPYRCACALLGTHPLQFDSHGIRVFAVFSLVNSLHQQIAQKMFDDVEIIKEMKMTAREKIDLFTKVAQVIFPISKDDAEACYGNATQVVDEVDIHIMHELRLIERLVTHAVGNMDSSQKREIARDLAIIADDGYRRLLDDRNFPWEEIASALTTLDVSFALAAVSRWDDTSLVTCKEMLPSVLFSAIEHGNLSPTQVCGLLAFLDDAGPNLMSKIMEAASDQNKTNDVIRITENLAKEELLRFGRGTRPGVTNALSVELPTTEHRGYWLSSLYETTEFIQCNENPSQSETNADDTSHNLLDKKRSEHQEVIDRIDWTAHRIDSLDNISEVIREVRANLDGNSFFDVQEVFDRIRSVVGYGDRTKHLEALANLKSTEITDTQIAQAIADCIHRWEEAPAAKEWCKQKLLPVTVEHLPGFAGYLPYGESPLPELLTKCGKADSVICSALLEAVEQHVEKLHDRAIFAIVGLVANHCKLEEVVKVIECRLKRLLSRIPEHQREVWNLSDIPEDTATGLSHFLYALMGDVDVRIRWRAAHVLRRLAFLGENEVLKKINALYDKKSFPNFRKPDAPFYWLAARLWLLITLDRIAEEKPPALRESARWLFQVATDDSFPHLLVRQFAKSASNKLIKNKVLKLNAPELYQLNSVNVSPLSKQEKADRYGTGGFHENSGRRFQFDTLDTTRYWYAPLIGVFADMDMDRFLDVAERWIIDHWEIQEDPWKKDNLRGRRFNDRWELSSHSHGSLPTIERFRTYLEWHAMWCAVGELIQTDALAKSEEDNYYALESVLERECLVLSPWWLADLQGPKPLERRFWLPPAEEVNVWLENIKDSDFLNEILPASCNEKIVVDSYHETKPSNFYESVQVDTALVSPDTGHALIRALQTVDSRWFYGVPRAGHYELPMIDAPPYQFKGWLMCPEPDTRIEEKDPFRYGISGVKSRPHDNFAGENLDFVFNSNSKTEWVNSGSGKQIFVYEAWGDTQGDEPERVSQYDTRVRSSGWRLMVDKMELKKYLDSVAFDLLIEITITRRNKGYEYSRYDQEEALESEYDRVLIFRRDGSIDAVEGRIGTWFTPDP